MVYFKRKAFKLSIQSKLEHNENRGKCDILVAKTTSKKYFFVESLYMIVDIHGEHFSSTFVVPEISENERIDRKRTQREKKIAG